MDERPPGLRAVEPALTQYLERLQQRFNLAAVVVIGSRARGDHWQHSDLDLLVTFDEPPSLFRYVALENRLSDVLGVKVDLVMKDSLKPTIAKHILEEAQPI